MIVVSDTTPLISLLKINRVDLLEKLFGEVLIPDAVFSELTVDERFRVEADQIRPAKLENVQMDYNVRDAILARDTIKHYWINSGIDPAAEQQQDVDFTLGSFVFVIIGTWFIGIRIVKSFEKIAVIR